MRDDEPDKPQVVVCQRGARHRYAIPRLLQEAGMLAALYTDSSAYSYVGRLAQGLNRWGMGGESLRALAARIPSGVPRDKVYSSDSHFFSALFRGQFLKGNSLDYRRWGLHGTSVIYSMYGEDVEFLEWAKEQNAKIIIDVFVHPETNRIVADERLRLFGEERSSIIDLENAHSLRIFNLADLLVCPSEWVAEGVRNFMPACEQKIRVVPYGSSVKSHSSTNNPVVGSILFAGREPLRKGLHYLADAARILRLDGMQVDVRVAGVKSEEIGWIKNQDQLNCLGPVPMEQMQAEYNRADVFVLSSLSEGQAGVLLEAMACGCPVVSSRESGVDYEPGCGVTVPARDAEALASALKKIILDRSYRDQLAKGALRQAEQFSMENWKQRLVEMVGNLCCLDEIAIGKEN
jgi:glycosyltransferase involved in cell wall biosynthesis